MVPRGTYTPRGLRHADRSAESARGRGRRPSLARLVAMGRDVPRLRERSATTGGVKWTDHDETTTTGTIAGSAAGIAGTVAGRSAAATAAAVWTAAPPAPRTRGPGGGPPPPPHSRRRLDRGPTSPPIARRSTTTTTIATQSGIGIGCSWTYDASRALPARARARARGRADRAALRRWVVNDDCHWRRRRRAR